MKDLIVMWKNPRMVILTAVSAAVYVAAMLPFKWMTLIPGLAEIRPASVFPIVMSFLFGPAGAWGSAIGNLVGDMLGGMFGPGSLFGFGGNLLYGYLPYKLWTALFPGRDLRTEITSYNLRMKGPLGKIRVPAFGLAISLLLMGSALALALLTGFINEDAVSGLDLPITGKTLILVIGLGAVAIAGLIVIALSPWRLSLIILFSSISCAMVIAWGIELMGWVPFHVLGVWIVINNFSTSILLAPTLFLLLEPRARNLNLLYTDLIPTSGSQGRRSTIAAIISILLIIFIYSLGLFLGGDAVREIFHTLWSAAPISESTNLFQLKGLLLLPLILLLFISSFLI